MTERLSPTALWILLALCALSPLLAQDGTEFGAFGVTEANLARGFQPGQSYAYGDFDTVNLFNGNLTMNLPIGSSYPVGGGFDYQLQLTYNSNVWDVFDRMQALYCGSNDQSGELCCNGEANHAWPSLDSNAGVGWRLSLGELFPPLGGHRFQKPDAERLVPNQDKSHWLFIAPDGSRHYFFDQLYAGTDDQADAVSYTRDGSFLRLTVDTQPEVPPHTGGHTRRVEMPDGTRLLFGNVQGRWLPYRIEHPHKQAGQRAAYLDVFYAWNGAEWTWTLRDTYGREHAVVFETNPYPTPGNELRLQQVRLAAFGGQQAVYSFDYGATAESIVRPYSLHTDPDTASRSLDVSLLQRIVGPHNEVFDFDYVQNGNLQGNVHDGLLERMEVPTGAVTEYEYSGYWHPLQAVFTSAYYNYPHRTTFTFEPHEGSVCETLATPASSGFGIAAKTVKSRSGETVSRWEYEPRMELCSVGNQRCEPNPLEIDSPSPPKEFSNTVRHPDGTVTRHFFSAYPGSLEEDHIGWAETLDDGVTPRWSRAEYGAAITKRTSVQFSIGAADGHTAWLSSESYERGANPDTADPLRVEGLSYVSEQACVEGHPDAYTVSCEDLDWSNNHRRVKGSVSEYRDDILGTRVERLLSDYDGLGHYRNVEVEARGPGIDFGGPRREFTAWNRESDGSGGSFAIKENQPIDGTRFTNFEQAWLRPSVSQPWMIEGYAFTHVEEAGRRATSQRCVDSWSGLVTASRELAAVAKPSGTDHQTARATDPVVVYDYDAHGNVSRTRWFGGEVQPLASGQLSQDICVQRDRLASAQPEYRVESTYSFGSLAEAKVTDCSSGAEVLRLTSQTIDASTGKVASSRTPSDLEMTYDYDQLGRMLDAIPAKGQGARSQMRYFTGRTNTTVEVKTFANRIGDDRELTFHKTVFDGLGRATTEERKRADGTLAKRSRNYDSMSRVVSESGWNHAGRTETVYDAFGRVERITLPDGSVSNYAYRGDRETRRTARVQTGVDTTSLVTRIERRDFQGRLIEVVEDSEGPGSQIATRYTYDPLGNLLQVATPRSDGGAQIRLFEFDHLGVLRSEEHPELSGPVTYSAYDSRRLPHRVRLSDGVTLDTEYDAAGRTTLVWADGERFKSFSYGRHDGSSSRAPSVGRLVESRRHNLAYDVHFQLERDHVVRETYE